MFKQAFSLIAFGLGLVLGSASCGPTCPAGQQSCGTANANTSDAGDSKSESTCDMLTALRSCMKSYCATASNPFCTCWTRGVGYDIDTGTCKCVDFDAKAYCDQNKGADPASYDCAAASSGVSSICVGVNPQI